MWFCFCFTDYYMHCTQTIIRKDQVTPHKSLFQQTASLFTCLLPPSPGLCRWSHHHNKTLCAVQHPQNLAVPDPVRHPAAGSNPGGLTPRLLQRPPNRSADMLGKTTADDPERGGASGFQPAQEGACHTSSHGASLVTCSCSHQVQDTYACLQSDYRFRSHLLKCSCKGKCYPQDAALVF